MRALFDELKHDPELIGIGAASLGALYGRRKLMAAAGGGGSMALNRAAGQIEGASAAQKSASTTFAEAVAEFRAGVREMAGRGGGSGAGSAVNEAEKDAAKFAPGALPALGAGALAGIGAGIVAAGGVAGAMNVGHADEYGRDAGTWGGDAPSKDNGPIHRAAPRSRSGPCWSG